MEEAVKEDKTAPKSHITKTSHKIFIAVISHKRINFHYFPHNIKSERRLYNRLAPRLCILFSYSLILSISVRLTPKDVKTAFNER